MVNIESCCFFSHSHRSSLPPVPRGDQARRSTQRDHHSRHRKTLFHVYHVYNACLSFFAWSPTLSTVSVSTANVVCLSFLPLPIVSLLSKCFCLSSHFWLRNCFDCGIHHFVCLFFMPCLCNCSSVLILSEYLAPILQLVFVVYQTCLPDLISSFWSSVFFSWCFV